MEISIIDEFTEQLRRKGRKRDTLAEYRYNIMFFREYLASCQIFSFFAAKRETVERYFCTLRKAGITQKTYTKRIRVVYHFYEWLKQQGQILSNPVPWVRSKNTVTIPHNIPDRTSLKRIYYLLSQPNTVLEYKNYALIDLSYSCGLRRCELHRLNIGDIDMYAGTLRVTGKKGSERVVPLGKRTMKTVCDYIYHARPKIVKAAKTKAVFVSWQKGGKRMAIGSINRVFVRLRKKYGFGSSMKPHALRHAYATDMVRNGAPIQDVSRMLGHVKLETTQIYTHLGARELQEHHCKYHPRSGEISGNLALKTGILNYYGSRNENTNTNAVHQHLSYEPGCSR